MKYTSNYLVRYCLSLCFCLSGSVVCAVTQPGISSEAREEVAELDEQQSLAEGQSSRALLQNHSLASGYRLTDEGLPIYGSQLFQGDFGDLSFSGFNPNYQIGIGDQIKVLIWGALEEELALVVDAKGNVFIPRVGPIQVQGVRNDDLNRIIQERIQEVYKDNVESYASLNSTQQVKVFVSGCVLKPGLYHGFASDSVLHYLDQAGGVDARRGSYLKVNLVRGGATLRELDLYQFLQKGELPLSQFQDGDVILVQPRANTVSVTGKVANPARFEFVGESAPLGQILEYAQTLPAANSVSVRRVHAENVGAQVYALDQIDAVRVQPGDVVRVSGKKLTREVLVSLTGEFHGLDSLVFPAGTCLSEVIAMIEPAPMSNMAAIQLFRKSVAERQATLIQQSLDNLERKVVSAGAISLEEAQLRQVERETILAFIERARKVEPTGQVLMVSEDAAEKIYLQDGDVIHIPRVSNLVTVHGEVQYPNTQVYQDGDNVRDYIERAGGFTPRANEKELVLVRANGYVDTIGKGRWVKPSHGDEIIVLPKQSSRSLTYASEISSIIYQIALGARVVVGL